MSANAFERILSRLSDAESVTEKTAADQTTPSTQDAMLAAVRKVAESTKTASPKEIATPDPVTSLEVMAKEAAAREEGLLIKQAENMGAAICDGFFARMAQYDTALQATGKTASAAVPTKELLTSAVKEAYAMAKADLEKEAEAAFQQGYDETIQQVYKTAAETHYAGQMVARELIAESK